MLPCWTALERLTGIRQYSWNYSEKRVFGCQFPHASICPVLWFQLFNLFLPPFPIQYLWLLNSNCGANKQWGENGWVMKGVNGENIEFTGTKSISVCLCVCICYNAEQRSLKSPLAQPVILLEGLLCCPRLSDRGKNSFRSAV